MLFTAKVRCPACQGQNCRESRWLSLNEKRNHQGCSPYRCLDCSHRFLMPHSGRQLDLQRILIGAVLVGAVAVIAGAPLLTTTDNASQAGAQQINALQDPDVRRAAEGGDPLAQFRLGEALFHDPARTDETSAQAVRWLQRAAENGNTDAMIFLGRLSRTGVGILQDFDQASAWIRTAAVHGSPEGMLEMGRLYRDGVGVEKDLVKAYAWFNRASAARNLDAVREREMIARILTPSELKEAQRQSSALPGEGDGRARPVRNP